MQTALCKRINHSTLSAEAEQEACLRAFQGCEESQNNLILHLLNFLSQVVSSYRLNEDLKGECWSEGAASLIQAVRKFDPRRGYSLKSFASWYIHAAIRHILRQQPLISIPKNKWYAMKNAVATNSAAKTSSEIPTTISFEDISIISQENFPASDKYSPAHSAERSYLRETICEGLDQLSDFEKQIICERYGINRKNITSSRELGKKLNCNRSAILKAEESAKRSLRLFFENKGLRSFIGGE